MRGDAHFGLIVFFWCFRFDWISAHRTTAMGLSLASLVGPPGLSRLPYKSRAKKFRDRLRMDNWIEIGCAKR